MTQISALVPPGVILMIGGLLLALLRGAPAARAVILPLAPLVTLWAVWQVPDAVVMSAAFLDYRLDIVEGGALSRLFATIFAIMAFLGGLYAMKRDSVMELAAAFIYAGGAVGVCFAGDLVTLFVFWEVMAIASATVIWANRTEGSFAAGMRYLFIHLLGGVLLMAGIAAWVMETGSLELEAMAPADVATWLMLAGVLVNAGAPPLWAWVGDAYPEASWSGTVFLSAFTTKTAVYVVLVLFPGVALLTWIGLAMIVYGIIYALLDNDIRRILAYSIVNQVGFMLVAAGIGTEMALNGAAAHAFAHIIYKALLLMSAGAVLYQTGIRKATDLGGLAKTMPITAICGIIGAFAIAGFPATSGYVSKSLITTAAADAHLAWVWFPLETASAATFVYLGLRWPWLIFFGKNNSGLTPKDPPPTMTAAMVLTAVLCIGVGIWPSALYGLLPVPPDYSPYSVYKVVHQLQLLLFAGLAFFALKPLLRPKRTVTLDFDWFYRRFGTFLAAEFGMRGVRAGGSVLDIFQGGLRRFVTFVETHHGPGGLLARTWATSTAVFGVVLLLLIYLIIYFV
ncbi:NADH-ubiquinone oxidoreductase chain L [Caenispirillum salinarum AK4]|uniref:NADH-ubiquinone oxidoreductase chain L n=1 Tax=Caenispirillum salinarum AK4 TaxID=1238182 RepID=K9GY23_9PROT|nr:Na(+)/H(+) antiporter subunit D [Caenispirillum salinarum]EKV30910.1 NADH-ubiquinone oxidoreductase chain L [Caenispirillum salinarum AK4]